MKRLKFLVFLLFTILFSLPTVSAQRNYWHVLNDTVWASDTVKVANSIIVANGAVLMINPGVYIEFQGNYSIDVYGKIKAMGTEADTIFFTTKDTTGFADTATYAGGWGSIRLLENDIDTSVFSYCKFSYGKAVFPNHYPSNDNEDIKGGTIYANDYHALVIDNSYFFDNYATYSGGAIHINNCSSARISSNLFENNKVFTEGGAILLKNSNYSEMIENVFISNVAFHTDTTVIGVFGSGAGGGISAYSNCSFINNSFFNNKSINGALYESTSNSYICGNLISNNFGIGLMNGHSAGSSKYLNNIIVNNETPMPGSGIYVASEDLQLRNNIVWGNTNYLLPNQSVQIPTLMDITADITYSCVQDGYPGTDNISTYPQFTNPTEGAGIEYDGLAADWTLLDSSPCINTGTPDTTGLNLPEFDIAGNPRIFGGRIEMGAYENQNVYVKINDSPVYSKIKLYPNPGTDKIFIDIPPQMEGAWIDIVDGQSRVLMHKQINFSPAVLSPYKLKAGIYFYRIYNENKIVKSGKWIKR